MNRVMNHFPTCPHFALCSGCELASNFFELPIKELIFQFFQENGAPLFFRSNGFEETRWKAKLAIRGTISDPKIGLFKKHSHEVISIPLCLVHHRKINEAVSALRRTVVACGVVPYSETSGEGILRYAQFFVERETNRVQLALGLNLLEKTPGVTHFLDDLRNAFPWHSIWVNWNVGKTNRIFSENWELISGDLWLWQRFGDAWVAFHPGSFSQSHLPLFETALATIQDWVFEGSSVLELFAGTGAISLFIEPKCSRIDLVENNPFSALSFEESRKRLGPEKRKKLTYHLKEADSLSRKYDVIVVDPPRKGIGPSLLDALKQTRTPRLIYMSCDFQSFQRDAKELVASGWMLKQGEGFFFFPGTHHIEILALFDRGLPAR